jgi:hypothetical protein
MYLEQNSALSGFKRDIKGNVSRKNTCTLHNALCDKPDIKGNVSRKTELLEFYEPAHRRRATKDLLEILFQGIADFGDFQLLNTDWQKMFKMSSAGKSSLLSEKYSCLHVRLKYFGINLLYKHLQCLLVFSTNSNKFKQGLQTVS